MTQKIMTIFTEELLNIQKRAEQTVLNIEQIKDNLDSERQELWRLVKEYDVKRVELFLKELHAQGLTWCTHCSKALSEIETEFIFIEGRKKYSHGYENSYYGFRAFSKLHCTCVECREEFFNKHGQHGAYDNQTKDQSSFFAFRVEKREDGYYARKFGNWVKLENEKCVLSAPPSKLIEHLAEEWNLPPRIELNHRTYENDKLVVHERTLVPVHERVVAAEVV